jgi:hypothetical protein
MEENRLNFISMIVNSILKEYEALRSEINEYHKQQKDAINFALVLTGLFFSFITSDYFKNNKEIQKLSLLIFPIYINLIAYVYLDRTLTIPQNFRRT